MVPPPATCCSALLATLANKTLLPGSSAYNESLASYFSAQEAEVHPSCIVSPTSSTDVSSVIRILTRLDCAFAIRSGGYSIQAGDANIADKVTIDLSGLNSISVSQNLSQISVGPGARWGDVYRASEASQLVVPGGRVATVGVGGLTTGGGVSSFSARFGWTCDSVANMEVVIASGDIINVNDVENPGLLQVLRGGSNNFGIVTRFDFHAYPQGDIWGGTVTYDIDTLPQQLDGMSKLTSADPYDEYASVVLNFVYDAGGALSIENDLQYTKAVEYPAFFKPLTDIPHSSDTLHVGNLSSFADEGAAGYPIGMRALLATTTHGASVAMLNASFNAWNKSNVAFAGTSVIQARLFLEALPPNKAAPGTNVLGVSSDQGNLLVVAVTIGWTNASEDTLMNQIAQAVVDDIDAAAKELGEYDEYKYLNYASPWQDVIKGYGAENVAKMRNMSKVYDPRGVFQGQVPGGFKLFRV
ncbi:hypothetical protein F4779DRAFT_627777 [Xylariaceae sp. FL0662B]|nr:hypothetical protein F4779DRAFT_627777 [Xylariaceae sp. FL0662B]